MEAVTDKVADTLAIIEAYIRAHPYKTLTALFSLGTFATAAVYVKQLSHALPSLEPLSVPANKPQMMYLIPPGVTIIVIILEMYLVLQGTVGAYPQLGLAVVMLLGWLVTAVLWGHCHIDAQDEREPGQAWPKICYKYNLYYQPHGYIVGVNKALGDAVLALGALLVVFFAGFVWTTWKNGGGEDD